MDWVHLFDILRWIFNPAELVEAGLTIFGYLSQAIGWVFTQAGASEVGSTFTTLGTNLQGVPVTSAWNVALYMMSPVVSPTILNGCISVCLLAWLVSLVMKCTMAVKSFFWTAGA